jgi:hypothetical protein
VRFPGENEKTAHSFETNFLSSFVVTGTIEIATLPNQDPLEASTGLKPLLGIDVWEVRTR